MDETRGERRAPTPGQPEQNVPPRDEDPHASPLGRGADPGKVRETYPLSSTRPGIAGQRGQGEMGQRGGPSGLVDRENEDMTQEARDAPSTGLDSSPNDADA